MSSKEKDKKKEPRSELLGSGRLAVPPGARVDDGAVRLRGGALAMHLVIHEVPLVRVTVFISLGALAMPLVPSPVPVVLATAREDDAAFAVPRTVPESYYPMFDVRTHGTSEMRRKPSIGR